MGRQDVLERPTPSAPHGDEWVHRFGRTERFAHWWTVSLVATALVTGLLLGDDETSGPLITLHWGAVALLGAGLLLALLIGNRRALLHAAWKLFTFDRRDAVWIRDHLRSPLGRGPHGEYGMFNPGQKALAWGLAGAVTAVIWTGIDSLNEGGDSAGPHATAVVVAMVLVGAHVFMAALNPATNPALHGMISGRVRRSWLATHHGAWLKEIER